MQNIVRDLSALNTSHLSGEDYTLDTPEETIFASNGSCVLSPEVTEGPYYVSGEFIRENVTDGQAGVDLHLELQVLDVNTCEPIANAYTEIWGEHFFYYQSAGPWISLMLTCLAACNSTGVYSGVSANGNGNSASDTTNLDATFARGIQPTDTDGVASFDTLFPGHYTGRTTHIHVLVHLNATARDNATLLDTTASHVGQVFFDQDLIYEVEATSVYAANTQQLTLNENDGILAQEAATSDPFVEYVLLGDTVESGLLGWLAFGIDPTLSKSVNAAATLYETGGVQNNNGGGGGPGGPPPTI